MGLRSRNHDPGSPGRRTTRHLDVDLATSAANVAIHVAQRDEWICDFGLAAGAALVDSGGTATVTLDIYVNGTKKNTASGTITSASAVGQAHMENPSSWPALPTGGVRGTITTAAKRQLKQGDVVSLVVTKTNVTAGALATAFVSVEDRSTQNV